MGKSARYGENLTAVQKMDSFAGTATVDSGKDTVESPSGGTMRRALGVMLRILPFLSVEPGKQPFDQLNRRLRNRDVSVLPHADRGARDSHALGKERLGKLEPMPDGHKEDRFHVTLSLRAATATWAGWLPSP